MATLLIKGAHLSHVQNVWSRHTTPQMMCHLLFTVDAQNAFNIIDQTASWLFVLHHSILGDWASIAADYKRPDGGPLHQIAGMTPNSIPQPGGETFGNLTEIDVLTLGHLEKWINGETSDGSKICGVQWVGTDGEAFRDSIKSSERVWETGQDWGAVSSIYKFADGSSRADPASIVRKITTITWDDSDPGTPGP